jgi:hypothetical protein
LESIATPASFPTLNDTFAPPRFSSGGDWQRRGHICANTLESAGLLPLLEKTPLNPIVSGEIEHEGLKKLEERSRAAAG